MKNGVTSSYQIAFGGVIAAVSLVIMLITGFIPIGTYACPALAGFLLAAVVIELGAGWAWAVFAAVALASVFFAGDKEAALYYMLFFGFYPILKAKIETISTRWGQRAVKCGVFNLCMVAAFYVGVYLLSVPKEAFTLGGVYLPLVFLLFGNLFFIVYDIAATRLITVYIQVWRKKLFKNVR